MEGYFIPLFGNRESYEREEYFYYNFDNYNVIFFSMCRKRTRAKKGYDHR